MNKKTWYTALTGVLFLILVIIGIALSTGDVDATKDSAAKIANQYNDDYTKTIISTVVEAVAGVVLVWYALHLRHALRDAVAAPLIVIGAAIIATGLAVDASLGFALLSASHDPDVKIDPAAIQALALAYNNDFAPFIIGGSLMALSAGLATLKTGVLPKWLGWIAIVIGVFVFAGPVGFFGLILLILWNAITSVMLALKAKNQPDRDGVTGIPGAA